MLIIWYCVATCGFSSTFSFPSARAKFEQDGEEFWVVKAFDGKIKIFELVPKK
jgi:hypothetical protein